MMEAHTPFFSVIIPTYNRCNAVVKAVESVLAQTYTNFEVIVVDDGSTDDTATVLKALAAKDKRVVYIFQENQERSAARNNGIDHAKGEYVCFLDSDDTYEPAHLGNFLATLQAHDFKAALYYCGGKLAEAEQTTLIEPIVPEPHQDPLVFALTSSPIGTVFVCLSTDILKKHRFNEALSVGEDRELWSRVLLEYPLIVSPHHTVIVNDYGDRTVDIANLQTSQKSLATTQYIIDNLGAELSTSVRRKMQSAAYFKLAQSYLANKKRLAATAFTLRAIFTYQDKYSPSLIVFLIRAMGLGFLLPSRFKQV